jgi:hypothetical protein
MHLDYRCSIIIKSIRQIYHHEVNVRLLDICTGVYEFNSQLYAASPILSKSTRSAQGRVVLGQELEPKFNDVPLIYPKQEMQS